MKNTDEIILTEEFDPGLKHALFSNFSNYREAILEIVDNSVSHRLPGKVLTINITISKKDIRIVDIGGEGMNIEQLKEFLAWGKIKSRKDQDIGAYSQGGKSAMGYLGQSMVIVTSPVNDKMQYRIEDSDLHKYKLKKYPLKIIPADFNEGRTMIEIGGLKRKNINNEVMEKILVDSYRPLIEKNEVVVKYNGEVLKVPPFPLDESFKVEPFSFPIKDRNGSEYIVKGWIGRLGARTGLKGGMKCYLKGRLICDRQYFGHPDATYKATLNFLFGEIYLDCVPANTNKTDFDHDSPEWEAVEQEMHKLLDSHVKDLLGKEIKEPTDEEKDRAKDAKQIVSELMKMRKKEFKGKALEGEAFGQKEREARDKKSEKRKISDKRGKYEPKTPPPKGASGKRRRLKEFMDWEIRPMEESTRSNIEEKGESKLLVINNLFPGYLVSKGTMIYLIETAALQLAMPEKDEKITPKEYINDFDELYGFFCDNLDIAKEKIKEKKKK